MMCFCVPIANLSYNLLASVILLYALFFRNLFVSNIRRAHDPIQIMDYYSYACCNEAYNTAHSITNTRKKKGKKNENDTVFVCECVNLNFCSNNKTLHNQKMISNLMVYAFFVFRDMDSVRQSANFRVILLSTYDQNA